MDPRVEQEFIHRYKPSAPPAANYLTATKQEMEATLSPLVTAIVRMRMPHLEDDVKKAMGGNITPEMYDVGLALIDVLGLRGDFAKELFFDGSDVQWVLDLDVELRSFVDGAARTGLALLLSQAMLNGTAGALNAQALLDVTAELQRLDTAGDRKGYDRLWAAFEQSFEKQQSLHQPPGSKAPTRTLKQHTEAVGQQLQQATADSTVLQAVADILAAQAKKPAAPPPAPTPKKKTTKQIGG